jgi:phosphoserine phosphatase RsbU/P
VKLLIAEDDPMSRRLMRAVLTDLQLEILTAGDGEEALECIESDAPAIIMLDWILPRVSGLEVCQKVRQRNSLERPYIVMVTFRDDKDDDVVAAFDAGADDYITKPIHPRQLQARITGAMRLVLREHALMQEQAVLQSALASLCNMPPLVPICSYCRRVSDGDSWLSADRYLSLRTGVQFTHGLCPTCAPRLMEPKRRTQSGMPDFGVEELDRS